MANKKGARRFLNIQEVPKVPEGSRRYQKVNNILRSVKNFQKVLRMLKKAQAGSKFKMQIPEDFIRSMKVFKLIKQVVQLKGWVIN